MAIDHLMFLDDLLFSPCCIVEGKYSRLSTTYPTFAKVNHAGVKVHFLRVACVQQYSSCLNGDNVGPIVMLAHADLTYIQT